MPITETVTEFLIANEYTEKEDTISQEVSLIENGYIDSVGMIRLISYLQEVYQIVVHEDELLPENFDSLGSIEKFVKEKLETDADR